VHGTFSLHSFPVCCPSSPTLQFPEIWLVSWWRLRPDTLQDEYGKSAPPVTQHENIKSRVAEGGRGASSISPRAAKDAWLATALEQLAQMCGAFVRATAGIHSHRSPAPTRLRIDVNVGDALDFCDALATVNDTPTSASSSNAIPPIAFQQDTLQPLQLRAGILGPLTSDFDVIKSSNLADHLGARIAIRRIGNSVERQGEQAIDSNLSG